MSGRNAPLRLDSLDSLPLEFKHRLEPYRHDFERYEHLETVLRNKRVKRIAEELSEYLRKQDIRAYHCTKEPYADFFEKRGLRLTDIRSHQEEFLHELSDIFTPDELNFMKSAWADYFTPFNLKHRNNRIWMCLTKRLANNSGTEPFFTYYGGEAIYFPLREHPPIEKKLREIGQPVVVEICVRGGNLRVFRELSEPLLGALHQQWRSAPTAPSDLECHQVVPVPPEDILAVRTLVDFQSDTS